MVKKIIAVILIAFGAFAGVVALQPSEFKIERSVTVHAPAKDIFGHVNNLANWQPWSPWAKLDPNMKVTNEGPSEGVGAVSHWSGNWDVGQGSMTIIESRPNEYVKFQLDFIKPMKSNAVSEFIFKPKGDETEVTWNMSGTNNFIGKAMSLVFNCEKMVGGQFEKGLADLKTLSEKK